MFTKKQCVTLLFMVFTVLVSAQTSVNSAHLKNDLGIFFNVTSGMPSISFRKVINDNYKLRIGISHTVEKFNVDVIGHVVYGSDSLVVQEYQVNNYLKPALQIGFDRQLPYKYLSIGADLQIQYINEDIHIPTIGSEFTDDGVWKVAAYDLFPNNKRVTNHYLSTTLRGNLSAQFPLGDNFLLSAYYVATVGPQFFLKESNRNDPAGDFPELSGFSIEVESRIGVGVRYLFNRKNVKS